MAGNQFTGAIPESLTTLTALDVMYVRRTKFECEHWVLIIILQILAKQPILRRDSTRCVGGEIVCTVGYVLVLNSWEGDLSLHSFYVDISNNYFIEDGVPRKWEYV